MKSFQRYLLQQRGCEKGITLVEVMLSVVILSVSAVFCLQALARIAQTQQITQNRTIAYDLFASKMAELELALGLGEEGLKKKHGMHRSKLNNKQYAWQVTSEAVDGSLDLKQYIYTLDWERGEHAYDIQAVTFSHSELFEVQHRETSKRIYDG